MAEERPEPTLLHELFERQAEARPEHVAIEFAGARWTYAALDRSANQLARLLRERGIGPGTLVALLLPRSADPYLAQLATLKAGAAYVPLDPDYPADRIGYILADAGVALAVTTESLAARLGGYQGAVLRLDEERAAIAARSPEPLSPSAGERDLCYVIYTSGTTGRPKGVLIEHKSASHFVKTEGAIFQVRPEDRVYQGFSLAFDASVEEVWLAFHAGAALVVATEAMAHSGPGLSALLTGAGVTVFSCVPTLLSMLEEDIPTLRLLILGGEACPQDLVTRWARADRRMVNTYGPTEATVVATYADCDPNRPVTIGRPLPGYEVRILDPEMRPVGDGETGELHIGGLGLARGYLGRDDLTAAKFVTAFEGGEPIRLYKSGDLARYAPDGSIEFLGRIDTQVKLRGFRVELAEIEAVLLKCPGVLASAVTVREDVPGIQQLVGYVVLREGFGFEERSIRAELRTHLPTYMVPPVLEPLASLPALPSGKVDRQALPAPRPREANGHAERAPARSPVEARVAEAWDAVFQPMPVGPRDHFFLDLGGHSLLAARMVSELRADSRFQSLSMLDVYQHPTIEALAAKAEADLEQAGAEADSATSGLALPFHRPSSASYYLCGAGQAVGLYFILGIFSLQWLAPYLTYAWLAEHDVPIIPAIAAALASLLAVYPVMLALSVAIKWLVIGRFKAGDYPLWGLYYLRWWFVNAIVDIIPISYMSGTPLLNVYCRLMGAKIGKNVHLGSDVFSALDLLTVGDDSSVGTDTSLLGYTVENGWLRLRPVHVGKRCFVGTRCVLAGSSVMEDNARLEDLSLLPEGTRVPRGETWSGSPARPSEGAEPIAGPSPGPSLVRRFAYGVLHAVGLFLFPVFGIAAILPGMVVLNALSQEAATYWYLLVSPLVAVSFVVLLCLEIALFKWVLLGRVRPGTYPLHGAFYWKKWFVDQLMELSLDVLGPLYSTIYLAPWYRLLGAKLGKRAEISTASFISPDLLTIGDEGFIADCVSLGAARVDRGTLTIAETRVGTRSFIGNSALLPPGAVVGDNALIGCLSVPPANQPAGDGTSWLGSPALFLPQRQESAGFSEERTYHPTRSLQVQRALIEFVRVTLPSTCFIVITSLLLSAVLWLHKTIPLVALVAVFPFVYFLAGLAATLFVVALKWVLMGTYRPGEQPLWSRFVWRTELLTALHENLADPILTHMLTRTPFVCAFFRLLGAKIGRRVFMNTTCLTEFDLVSIGDDVALNLDATAQTHLFEDRVMKMSRIEIGDRCTVGELSLVLYDTTMEPDSALGDLSLLMKGETLPAGTRWEGIPAERAAGHSGPPLPASDRAGSPSRPLPPPARQMPPRPLAPLSRTRRERIWNALAIGWNWCLARP